LRDVVRTRTAEPERLGAADLGVAVAAGGERVVDLVAVPMPPKQPRIVGLDEGIVELFDLLTKATSDV
jgi:hypothetical protein